MSQTQPDVRVVLVVENPELADHATAALAHCTGLEWSEVNDCSTAVEWLYTHKADLVCVLLQPTSLSGLTLLRLVWHGPLLCFCEEDDDVLDAVEAARALAILPTYGMRHIANTVRVLSQTSAPPAKHPPSHKPKESQPEEDSSESLSEEGRRENGRRLEQAQRMEAVGRLAGGIAHDFNNLLTVIGSYSDLATRKLDDGHIVVRYVEQIRKASTTAATLTRQLLAFSRRQVLQPSVIALNEIVDEISFMVQSLLGAAIEMRLRLDPELGPIEADSAQVQQVLLNLIVNAKDAMGDGGLLCIETRNVELDERYAEQFADFQPGSYVRLTVMDTGIGMDEATLARIYEPFFTTKPKGRGTGLGLPTVYGIVQQSGGYMTVFSQVGKGATFHVYLPRVDKCMEEGSIKEETSDVLNGQETILLIEDEHGVRELAALVLHEAGYHLLTAASPEEALAIEKSYAGKIDLVLTDVIMPQMTGIEVAIQLANRRPQTPVVYMSGYTEDAMAFQQLLDTGAYLIEKPFYPKDLLRMVRRGIDHAVGHELSTAIMHHATVVSAKSTDDVTRR